MSKRKLFIAVENDEIKNDALCNIENIDLFNDSYSEPIEEYKSNMEEVQKEHDEIKASIEDFCNDFAAISELKINEMKQKEILTQRPETITADDVVMSQESLMYIVGKYGINPEYLTNNKISVENMTNFPIEAYRVSTESFSDIVEKIKSRLTIKQNNISSRIGSFFDRLKNKITMFTTLFSTYDVKIEKMIAVASTDNKVREMIRNISFTKSIVDTIGLSHSGRCGIILHACKGNLTYDYIKKLIAEYDKLADNMLSALNSDYKNFKNVFNNKHIGSGITELYKMSEVVRNIREGDRHIVYDGIYGGMGPERDHLVWCDVKDKIVKGKTISIMVKCEYAAFNNQTFSGSLTSLYSIQEELGKVIKNFEKLLFNLNCDRKKIDNTLCKLIDNLNKIVDDYEAGKLKDDEDREFYLAMDKFSVLSDMFDTVYSVPLNKFHVISCYNTILELIINYANKYVRKQVSAGKDGKGWDAKL